PHRRVAHRVSERPLPILSATTDDRRSRGVVTSSGTERARRTLAYLRRKITTGEWAVGTRIPIEPELAETLGVGRSTIREAVRSLASIGMLETLPGRGTFVRSSTPTSAVLAEFLTAYTLEELDRKSTRLNSSHVK